MLYMHNKSSYLGSSITHPLDASPPSSRSFVYSFRVILLPHKQTLLISWDEFTCCSKFLMLVSSTSCTSVVVSTSSLLLRHDAQRLRNIKWRICTFLEEGFEHTESFTCIHSEYVGHCYIGLVSVPVAGNDPEVLCGWVTLRYIFVKRVSYWNIDSP